MNADRDRLTPGTTVRVVRQVVTAQGSYLGAVGTVQSDRPEADPLTEVCVEFDGLPGCAFARAELEVCEPRKGASIARGHAAVHNGHE